MNRRTSVLFKAPKLLVALVLLAISAAPRNAMAATTSYRRPLDVRGPVKTVVEQQSNATARRVKIPVVAAFLLQGNVGGCLLTAQDKIGDNAWANLKERTAWIMLGEVDPQTGAWATLPSYTIENRSQIGDVRMPATGDVLVITHERPLYVLDFKNTGERRRLDAPVNVPAGERDLTGGVLTPGTRVIVKDVSRDTGSGCHNICTVFARVMPEK